MTAYCKEGFLSDFSSCAHWCAPFWHFLILLLFIYQKKKKSFFLIFVCVHWIWSLNFDIWWTLALHEVTFLSNSSFTEVRKSITGYWYSRCWDSTWCGWWYMWKFAQRRRRVWGWCCKIGSWCFQVKLHQSGMVNQ